MARWGCGHMIAGDKGSGGLGRIKGIGCKGGTQHDAATNPLRLFLFRFFSRHGGLDAVPDVAGFLFFVLPE